MGEQKQSQATFEETFKIIKKTIIPCLGKTLTEIDKSGASQIYPIIKTSRYYGHLYWYKIKFPDEIRCRLKEEYKDVLGIHIMPYQITETDIIKAKPFNMRNCKKGKSGYFPEEILKSKDFVDYDSISGNFHKLPDGKYQVVLIKKNGLGKNTNHGPGLYKGRELENRVKKTWYFPAITNGSKNVKMNELINDAFKTILIFDR